MLKKKLKKNLLNFSVPLTCLQTRKKPRRMNLFFFLFLQTWHFISHGQRLEPESTLEALSFLQMRKVSHWEAKPLAQSAFCVIHLFGHGNPAFSLENFSFPNEWKLSMTLVRGENGHEKAKIKWSATGKSLNHLLQPSQFTVGKLRPSEVRSFSKDSSRTRIQTQTRGS